MKATEAKFLDFLKRSPQFVIPIYQRTYSWGDKECRQLWDDIIRTGSNEAVTAHFVGSIVYVEQGIYQITDPPKLLVIDGQQRLTTISLLIEALARHLGDREILDGFSARKLRHYYLVNPEESGDRHFKLLLTQTDRDSLLALIGEQIMPKEPSIRLSENFELFRQLVDEVAGDLETLCKGLAKLVIVDISLNRDQDNPQLIFESLNSTGRELSQADLVRNFILMGLDPTTQTRLYEKYWRPMEVDFGQEAYVSHFDSFMRHYLTVRTGEIPNIRDVYTAFKAYARSDATKTTEDLVADIRKYAGYYCDMALDLQKDKQIGAAFQDLRDLKVDVAYPLLLVMYDDYSAKRISKQDLLSAVRLIESYVFRRAVCAIPTNSLNKTFPSLSDKFDTTRYVESVEAAFLALPSYRRFPDDEEFMRELKLRDLYNFRSRNYWLRKMENYDRKEPVDTGEYTIEHIMPQNEALSNKWRADLGPEWERIHSSYLHTLGNLTLTGYNSEYGDRTFAEKRDIRGGFAESPLRLNQGLAKLDSWNEETIRARSERLAQEAVLVWNAPRPSSGLRTAKKVKSLARNTTEYHRYLATGPVSMLFEAFRHEVLAIDPCVSEEFLKWYVAYKAETNFVDVVPQVKVLKPTLNLPFADIRDPRGLCRDVSGVGRWGNGDVEVGLSSLDQLPYVIGLVRQSFDRQMGNGGDES